MNKCMPKTKVLIVGPYNKGTIARCTLNLWKAFQANKNVEVRCVLAYKEKKGFEEFDDCEVLSRYSKSPLLKAIYMIVQMMRLRQLKKRFAPDITISTLLNCNTLNVLSGGKELRVGIFHAPHSQMKAKGQLSFYATNLQYRLLYTKLNRLCCVSEEVRKSVIEALPNINKENMRVVYNVHPTEKIIQKSKEQLDNETEMEIFQKPVILYCGRLDKNKAPDRLVRAFANSMLSNTHHLVFIGPDDGYLRPTQELARQFGIEVSTHFLGAKTNPYKYIGRAAMLVSCSYSEGLPGVIIEALALGVPVIATNSTRGVWEIMNCSSEYDKNLDCIKRTHDGLITPNTGTDSYDDAKLCEAICMETKKPTKVKFSFKNKVVGEGIVHDFLNL